MGMCFILILRMHGSWSSFSDGVQITSLKWRSMPILMESIPMRSPRYKKDYADLWELLSDLIIKLSK